MLEKYLDLVLKILQIFHVKSCHYLCHVIFTLGLLKLIFFFCECIIKIKQNEIKIVKIMNNINK